MGIVQTTFSSECVRKWQLPATIIGLIFGVSLMVSAIVATILMFLNHTLTFPVILWCIISAMLFFGMELIYGDLLMSA